MLCGNEAYEAGIFGAHKRYRRRNECYPVFGPFIGAIPSALLLLISEPSQTIPFVILIVAIQQFDGNILGPYILGDSTGLPAFWVMVAIFLGGGLFGFAGMVLGVPIFAVIYAFAQEFIENLLKKKGLSPDTADYYPVPAAENEHKLSIGIFEKLKKVNVKNDKK